LKIGEHSSAIISKVWGMCGPLRDDVVSYGDYLEQLTYLIFLQMSDEYAKPPYNRETGIPVGYNWIDTKTLTGLASNIIISLFLRNSQNCHFAVKVLAFIVRIFLYVVSVINRRLFD
jgi:hypothetical protein